MEKKCKFLKKPTESTKAFSVSILGIINRKQISMLKKYCHSHIHQIIAHNHQNMQPILVPINKQRKQSDYVYGNII